MSLTRLQKRVLHKVAIATHRSSWYRAEGNGERVTLASLYKIGLLSRRAWRGREGEPDAANEYQLNPEHWK